MQRRTFLVSLLFLAACASSPPSSPAGAPEASAPPAADFRSERISIITRGQGPDVILIPGMTSHRDVWAQTAEALDDAHRVHLVQLNGFAGFPSAANADGPVAAPVAEEIARYIAESDLESPAVIGHSMGGTIGLMLAARHPEAVGRLMVVDMFPFMGAMFGGQTAEAVRPTADQIRAQMLSAPPGSATPMIEQMIANMTQTETARPELVRQARESDRTTVANSFHELIVTDLRPELASVAAPVTVLYVVPPNAPITREQYVGYMEMSYATLSNKRIVLIEDSYHFIMIDAFERFMREVDGFLAG